MLPKEKLRFYHLVRALSTVAERTGAPALTNSVLSVWLKGKYPELSRRGLPIAEAACAHPRVVTLANWLAAHDLLDGAFWLSSAYANWVGDETRKRRALFFTPPELSARLLTNIERGGVDLCRAVFMDPACGGGAFLAPIALRIRNRLRRKGFGPRRILNHIAKHVLGADIDPTLCRLSKFFLKMALYEEIVTTGYQPRLRVFVRDTLAVPHRHEPVDVVLCNPPYRKMPAEEAALYRTRYKSVIEGQPNLYTLFFQRAMELIKPGGIAALLTGTSFLSGESFASLRKYLLESAIARQIDIVGQRNGVFVGVEFDTAISVFRKKSARIEGVRRKTAIHVLGPTRRFIRIGSYALPSSGATWPIPKSNADARIAVLADRSPYRVSDYGYKLRIGTFVWNRDRRRRFFSERAAKRRAKMKAAFPLIWSSDISQGGRVRLASDGKRHRFVNMGHATHPSVVRKPAVVLQRVTSNDQPRRLVGAPISDGLLKRYGGVVGENHVVFLEQANGKGVLSPRQLARVLRSQPIDSLFRAISGAANVSAFELGQLPMPAPDALVDSLAGVDRVDSAVLRAFRKSNSG